MRLPESAQSRSDRWRPPSASSHRQEPQKGAWKSLTCLKRNTISQPWDIIPPLLWLPKFHRNFLHRAGRFIWLSQNTRYKVGGKKFISFMEGDTSPQEHGSCWIQLPADVCSREKHMCQVESLQQWLCHQKLQRMLLTRDATGRFPCLWAQTPFMQHHTGCSLIQKPSHQGNYGKF